MTIYLFNFLLLLEKIVAENSLFKHKLAHAGKKSLIFFNYSKNSKKGWTKK
jgi:hypothetical protein